MNQKVVDRSFLFSTGRASSKPKASSRVENSRHKYPAAILRGVVLLQCFGLLGIYYLGRNEIESDVFGLLYFDMELPESVAQAVDDAGVLTATFCGVLIALVGWIRTHLTANPDRSIAAHRKLTHWAEALDRISMMWVACWFLALALSHQWRGGPYAHLALGEHAVRYAAPLALLICIASVREASLRDRWSGAAKWILRVAAAATFATHGYKAIESYGQFLDLVLLTDLRWTNWQISEKTVNSLLTAIGWIDLLVAVVILTRWWPCAAVYMTLWGVITALSRMTAMGIDYWPSALLRAANGGVPMALFAGYWLCSRQAARRATETNPAPGGESLEPRETTV